MPDTPTPEALAAARAAYDVAVVTLVDECERYRAFLDAHRTAAGVTDGAEMTLANALLEGAFVDFEIGDIVAVRTGIQTYRGDKTIGIALEFIPVAQANATFPSVRDDLRVFWLPVYADGDLSVGFAQWEESWKLESVTPARRDAIEVELARALSGEADEGATGTTAAATTRPDHLDTAEMVAAALLETA